MKIGFIGLGIMGEAMCANIARKHNDTVYGYDVRPERCAIEGVIAVTNSVELARLSDIIITMVPKSEHSRAVYEEILDVLGPDKICIDMSTIEPKVSIEINEMVRTRGAAFLDAPVVKSRPAAEKGELGIYVGGPEEEYQKILPVLHYMGTNVIRMGQNGAGLVMKICHNALVSQIQNGVNETVTLAAANGIDVMTFAEAISYGGGQNFYLDSKKQVIRDQDFTTAFSIENMNKDVHICQALAAESGVEMPGEENVIRVYEKAMDLGLGAKDFSATYSVVSGAKEEA